MHSSVCFSEKRMQCGQCKSQVEQQWLLFWSASLPSGRTYGGIFSDLGCLLTCVLCSWPSISGGCRSGMARIWSSLPRYDDCVVGREGRGARLDPTNPLLEREGGGCSDVLRPVVIRSSSVMESSFEGWGGGCRMERHHGLEICRRVEPLRKGSISGRLMVQRFQGDQDKASRSRNVMFYIS
jgi:hypothetical protein